MTDKPTCKISSISAGIQVAAALLLIISFFLTWFRNPIFSVPGFKISRLLAFISIPQPVDLILKVTALLIPVGGLAIIILTLINKSAATVSMITGMLPIILILVLLFYHRFILSQLAAGTIIILVCAPILLISGALKSPGQ